MASLTRIVVAADGRLKANFPDNSILLLNSSGSAFIHVSPSGAEVHQLSSFALQKYAGKLAVALEFRNMHLDLPFICSAVRPQYEQLQFSTRYPLSSVRWPESVTAAEAAGLLQQQPDGSWTLESEDTSARLVLHPYHARFAVSYPLLVAHNSDANTYEYVWQTQLFSCSDYPERWRPAQVLLAEAAELHKQQTPHKRRAAADPASPGDSGSPPEATATLQCSVHSSRGGSPGMALSSLDRATALPASLPTSRPETAKFPKPSWWYECTASLLPQGECLQLQWMADAVYQYISSSQEVEVWLHADESCLTSFKQGRFLRHQRPGEGSDRVYAADAVPQQVWLLDGSGRYPLAPIASQASMFREHCANVASTSVTRRQHNAAIPSFLSESDLCNGAPVPLSNDIQEVQEVEGCGTFTAYADGRIRVVFADRTILNMDGKLETCSLVLPDASHAQVAVSNPIGVEQYVQPALQFASWAASTPAARAEHLRQQAAIGAEIQICQRAALLCDYAATKQVPKGMCEGDHPEKQGGPHLESLPVLEDGNLTLEPSNREAVVQAWLRKNAAMMARLA